MAASDTGWKCENENRKGRTKLYNRHWVNAFVICDHGEDCLKKSLRTSAAYTERTWAALKEASEI